MPNTARTGLYLALITAVISGLSIYLNKFAVMIMDDVVLFTTLKNTLVGFAFIVILGLARRHTRPIQRPTRLQAIGLVGLALLGGSIPFLLFFTGLATAAAPSAALIHKSLFLWVAALALPLFNEKLNGWAGLGVGLLALGQLLSGWPNAWGWGRGETLILIATLFWAVETLIAKRLTLQLGASVCATARMAGGAVVMWLFMLATNRVGAVLSLSAGHWLWILVTSTLLFGYVATWYAALRVAPATTVTGVLTLGAVITAGLTLVIEGRVAPVLQIIGLMAVVIGSILLLSRDLSNGQTAILPGPA